MTRVPARRDRGYALLVVLFVGAVMAIMIGMSLPRAAWEGQRSREDELMYRGGQYARAIQLFYRKNKRYPAKIEDLENFNNVRYLRHKFADPIAKSDEWRIVHMGPAGMFTDSLVYDKPKEKKEGESTWSGPVSTGIADVPGAGAPGSQPMGMADRLRASGVTPGQPGAPDPNAGPVPNPVYFNPTAPGMAPGAIVQGQFGGVPPSGPGNLAAPIPGLLHPGGQVVGAVPASGFPTPGAQPGMAQRPGFPPGFQPGITGAPGFPSNQGGLIGSPGVGSEAARIIQGLLTTPRPGGLAGVQAGAPVGGMGMAPGNNPGFGGGIAGVASKSEARGIKVYQERETYNEWEFVYDYRRDPLIVGALAAGGVPQQPGLNPQGTGPQQPQSPVMPINPAQPGLTGSPFGPPPGARGGQPSTFSPFQPAQR